LRFHPWLLIAMLLVQIEARAEIPGTARSNERDILRFDLNGGLATPSPGLAGGGTVLWTLRPAHAVGLSANVSFHELVSQDAKLISQAYDLVWEHSIALFEGYHAVRVRGGLGASRLQRSSHGPFLRAQDKNDGRSVWAGHGLVSIGFDVPFADLMWVRLGVWGERAFLTGVPNQGGIFVGWVFGGQWLGIGD
jgi:hypothetical protein